MTQKEFDDTLDVLRRWLDECEKLRHEVQRGWAEAERMREAYDRMTDRAQQMENERDEARAALEKTNHEV